MGAKSKFHSGGNTPAKSENNMLTRAHSKLGASSSDRWINCPGSVALCEQCPEPPTNYAAAEGTAAHRLAEVCLTGYEGQWPAARWFIGREKLLGKEFTEHGIKCTEEMADHVQGYVDFVRNKRNELGAELIVEKKFHLKHIHPDLFGTGDAVLVQPFGCIWIIDFKYGEGHFVEVRENTQLLYYALGAAVGEDFDEVTICVYQPRNLGDEERPDRTWTVKPKALQNFAKKLRVYALATEAEDAPLAAGSWCRWCKAAGVCPELHRSAIDVARTDFDDPQLPAVVNGPLTDDQLVKVVQYRKLFEKWFDQVEEYLQARLEKGERIEGVKLVSSKSKREWIDEKKAAKVLSSKLGDSAYERKLLSVAKAEDSLGKDSLVGLFRVVVGKPTIAHESDRRIELPGKAADDFDEIISEDDF